MARRRRNASAVDTAKRSCPVCTLNRIHAVFLQRQTVKNRRTDLSTCVCLECGAAWNESYMVRAQEIHTSNVRTREEQIAMRPIDRTASKTADDPRHTQSHEDGCPLCGGVHIAVKPRGNAAAECTCVDCAATWSHRYESGMAYRTNIKASVKEAV